MPTLGSAKATSDAALFGRKQHLYDPLCNYYFFYFGVGKLKIAGPRSTSSDVEKRKARVTK